MSAKQGNQFAQYNLGTMYENGNPATGKDDDKALEFYDKAASKGFEKARKAAENLRRKLELEKAEQKAKEVAVEKEQAKKQDAKDIASAITEFRNRRYNNGILFANRTDKTDPEIRYWLGYCYYYGAGVPKNAEEGKRWYHLSAADGYSPARDALKEIERVNDQRRLEEKRLAEQEQLRIEAGRKIAQERQARAEAEKKAEKERLARMEAERKAEQERQARAETEKKAEKERLARMEAERKAEQERQKDVKTDVTTAALHAFHESRWKDALTLVKNADQNNPTIQYYLGICYWNGLQVPADFSRAINHFTVSAQKGNQAALDMLEKIRTILMGWYTETNRMLEEVQNIQNYGMVPDLRIVCQLKEKLEVEVKMRKALLPSAPMPQIAQQNLRNREQLLNQINLYIQNNVNGEMTPNPETVLTITQMTMRLMVLCDQYQNNSLGPNEMLQAVKGLLHDCRQLQRQGLDSKEVRKMIIQLQDLEKEIVSGTPSRSR